METGTGITKGDDLRYATENDAEGPFLALTNVVTGIEVIYHRVIAGTTRLKQNA